MISLNSKKKFVERFRIKNFDSIFYYLSVKITKNKKNRIMHFNQTAYIQQLIENCDLINNKSMFIFMKQTSLYVDIYDLKFYQIIFEKIISYAKIIDKLQ